MCLIYSFVDVYDDVINMGLIYGSVNVYMCLLYGYIKV